jgi:hypothetical protein
VNATRYMDVPRLFRRGEAVDGRPQLPFGPRVEAGVSQEPKKHQLGNAEASRSGALINP